MSAEEQLRWMWMGCISAMRVWDDERWEALSTRYVELVREAGALSELPLALTVRGYMQLTSGDLRGADASAEELETLTEAIGGGLAPYCTMALASLRGAEEQATALVAATIEDANQRGEGIGTVYAEWAAAVLYNGLGQYDKALAAAQRSTAYDYDVVPRNWALLETVEAGVRVERTDLASEACAVISRMAAASGTSWVLGCHARCQALLADGEEAEQLYQEAISHLGKTRMRIDLARAHLLYGEWLRRARRRTDAREQLRTAQGMFEAMGMVAFAQRAGRELQATGETTRPRTASPGPTELTAQEAQIARLARDGLSNPEIGTRLFISAHTVQYHLRKVFTKLGITSRSQLDRVLPAEPPPA
jgi:ATP/maltotriose-dependent transcriptional regulator MalT